MRPVHRVKDWDVGLDRSTAKDVRALLDRIGRLPLGPALAILADKRPVGDTLEWDAIVAGVPDRGTFATKALLQRLSLAVDKERGVLGDLLAARDEVEGVHIRLFEETRRRETIETLLRRPKGIHLLCQASIWEHQLTHELAERFAARRQHTEATVRLLAMNATSASAAPAILTLAHWDEPQYVELLLSLANDASRRRDVRDVALEALCEMEAPEAIDTLAAAIDDEDVEETQRHGCVRALGEIGSDAALAALEALEARHKGGRVGEAIREAVQEIREGEG